MSGIEAKAPSCKNDMVPEKTEELETLTEETDTGLTGESFLAEVTAVATAMDPSTLTVVIRDTLHSHPEQELTELSRPISKIVDVITSTGFAKLYSNCDPQSLADHITVFLVLSKAMPHWELNLKDSSELTQLELVTHSNPQEAPAKDTIVFERSVKNTETTFRSFRKSGSKGELIRSDFIEECGGPSAVIGMIFDLEYGIPFSFNPEIIQEDIDNGESPRLNNLLVATERDFNQPTRQGPQSEFLKTFKGEEYTVFMSPEPSEPEPLFEKVLNKYEDCWQRLLDWQPRHQHV